MATLATETYYCQNKIELVRGGKPYFELLEDLIDRSTATVHLQTYIYDEDETGLRIAKALIRAASRGVKVYVLVDAFASQNLSAGLIHAWQKSGIWFKRFMPLLKSRYFYLGRRLHHKVVVVDHRYGLVGGLNISNRYNDFPDQPAWMDWAVFVDGEVAAELHNVCVRRGKFSGDLEEIPVRVYPETNCPIHVRVNDWVRGRMEVTKTYLKMFQHAEREIIIMSSYFLPGREFRKHLRRASKRGVSVKVIVAGPSDVGIAKDAERYLYPWLHKRGIRVFEYRNSILHGKMAVQDAKTVTIGSYNLNDISARASIELNVEIVDNAFAGRASGELHGIIERDCEEITDEAYHLKWGVFSRIRHNVAYHVFRLLLFLFTFYFKQRQSKD
ncbi:MAG: phosphatidylserine/phosphatidylglycerophosphate/cardiolipin synthase family protein [Cyclobacteriaceae bacterium]